MEYYHSPAIVVVIGRPLHKMASIVSSYHNTRYSYVATCTYYAQNSPPSQLVNQPNGKPPASSTLHKAIASF